MFDYLQKFNTLPQNLRDSVSSPAAMAIILELETKYKVDLAATVMKVMAKIIPLADLSIYFVSDFSLDQDSAKKLTAELKERLFFPAANYLGYNASYSSVVPKTAIAPVYAPTVDKIIKEAGVVFAGLELNARLKNILSTYIKGVRSRVDARFTLNKEIISGGLGLNHKTIDKIFKICDEVRAGQILSSGKETLLPDGKMNLLPSSGEPAKTGLDKVRELYEKPGTARDIPYNLKAAIEKGEIKKPVAPFNLPVPEETREKLLDAPITEAKPITIAPSLVKTVELIKPVDPIKKVENKIDVPATPIISKATIAPMVDAISVAAKIVAPAAASVVVPIAAAVKVIDELKPKMGVPEAPKINRPPEYKPGLFSKLFGHKKIETSKPIVKAEIPSVNNKASIASLRNEAAISQNKPIIKTSVVPDIKMTPKVMGPLEELRYLDLINFRRFGTTPEECVAKVESKIKLLEKDGYDKMISGVAAWHESPVNFLYLKMGQEALGKGVGFKQYTIDCLKQSVDNFLSWEEVEAIITLNSRLMF